MQTIWKGAISFGLVSIPVKVFSATEERGVSLRQVHAVDGGRIRYRRTCELDGAEVPYSDIAKGYDLGGGELVVLDDADLESLPLASTKGVEVLQFVAAEELDPVAVARSYYLQADLHGAKPYVLLRDALAKSGRIAIVKVALRSRESLATIRPHGDVLVLQMMLWPEEIRDPASLAPDADVTVRQQEVDMAQAYIETMTSSFDPADYTDEYAAALRSVVDAKVAGHQIVSPEAAAQPAAEVVDLMEALRQSVARAKARREGAAPPSGEPAAPPAAKAAKRPAKAAAAKAPAEKAPAKQAAAEKAPAKKAPAKNTAAKKATAKRTA
ncbi:MAG TPA: Ku protein [Sporichthyaceae bacterium]|jgi:DNA end-binding protein Ku|nr:Ku protein [Sporichthyaceae bacterium]